jgi:AmmeMemoRadiSam system protein B
MEFPKLRQGLEASTVKHQGQNMILLRDRLGYSKNSMILAPQIAQLLAYLDGTNSARDLQTHYCRMTGEILYTEQLQQVLEMLEDNLFLESERYIQLVAGETARFRQDPVRRAAMAGKAYPDGPQALRRQLESFLQKAEAQGSPTGASKIPSRRLIGLCAPHIDIQAGGACFGHAYRAISNADSPDTWVILGTGHEPVENYFALARKDFETPLGLVHCDQEYCTELMDRAPRDLLAGEYNHRMEHSVEFQAVFLSCFQPEARIVPVLCSFSLEDWRADREYIDGVAGLLLDLAQRCSGRRVGFLASVDLAHIGPRYGDRFRPDQGTVVEHLAADRVLLECLERCDATDFMRNIERGHNDRRICGMAPLYVLAKMLDGRAQGVILDHTYATVDKDNSFVTFASMAFYGIQGEAG